MPDYKVLSNLDGRDLKVSEKLLKSWKKSFKKRFPIIHKLITSTSNEFKIAKGILCFFIGTLYGAIIFRLTVANLDALEVKIKLVLGMFIITIIAIGMAFEVQMRCIMTLSLLSFISQAGRIIVVGYILLTITFEDGPIAVGLKNMKSLALSIMCYRTFLVDKYTDMYRIKWKPYKDIIVGLITGNKELLESGKRITKLVDSLESDMGEMNNDLQQAVKVGKDNEFIDDSFKNSIKNGKTSNFKKMFEFGKKVQCKGVLETGIQICNQGFDMIIQTCKEKLTIIGFVCNIFNFLRFCEFKRKTKDKRDEKKFCAEEGEKQSADGLDRDMSILDKLKGAFGSNNRLSMTYLNSKKRLQFNETYKQQLSSVFIAAKSLDDDLSTVNYYFQQLITIAKIISSYGFLLVFVQAFQYNKTYLNDITFDNCYITQYFRHIDARRFKAEKKTVLPMKRLEEVHLVYPTDIKLLHSQKKEVRYALLFCSLIVSFTIFVIIANFFVADFNHSVRKHGRIIHVQSGEHKIYFQVKGKGFIAKLLRRVLKDIHIEETVDKETDTEMCFPEVTYLGNRELIIFIILFILLYVLVYSEGHALRLNRVICSYFYRRWEKQRILWLYNRTLKNRKLYTKNLIKRAIMRSKGFELEPSTDLITIVVDFLSTKKKFASLVRLLKVLKIGLAKCILCDQTERIGSIRCEICQCSYCYECWLDAKQTCLVCTPSIYEQPEWKYEGNLKFE